MLRPAEETYVWRRRRKPGIWLWLTKARWRTRTQVNVATPHMCVDHMVVLHALTQPCKAMGSWSLEMPWPRNGYFDKELARQKCLGPPDMPNRGGVL